MIVAVINCGSSSIKYEVFDKEEKTLLAGGLLEKIGSSEAELRQRRRQKDGRFEECHFTQPVADHRQGFEFITRINAQDRLIKDDSELLGIGHRVVHGGERFSQPMIINSEVLTAIKALTPLAPLHNPPNLLGIEALQERFPGVPQVAVFDTMFHQTLPDYAFHYALPYYLYEQNHVRRYGFHGTSHLYVAKEAAKYMGRSLGESNLITLHLGNGASAAAIRQGKSIDTSMGLTPLEGLMMGTRCGDLDPAIHFYLMRQTGMSAEEVENLLNHESGLKGLCGLNDMREIERKVDQGDERALLAIAMFCYRIKKYIGSYLAVLGEVEAVVFTGGIGENSVTVRSRVCSGLEPMGISLDEGRNAAVSGKVVEIQTKSAPVKVLVIKTDEELEIARQTIQAIEKAGLEYPRGK